MKPRLSLIAHVLLVAACWLALLGEVRGQEVTILHNFGDGSVTNDGNNPQAALVLAPNGNFYGTTVSGGHGGEGCIFEMTPSGAVTVLYSFSGGANGYSPAGLVLGLDGNLYGMASGGSASGGIVFKITLQGAFKVIHNFDDGSVLNDGYDPSGNLVQGSDGSFYGTTADGGANRDGTVFKITPSGTVTILHSFGGTAVNLAGSAATDGSNPVAGLVQGTDGNFYGVAGGGSSGNGVVFRMTPTGTMTILHAFGDGTVTNDGLGPEANLVQGPDGNFYGTTASGGAFDANFTGTVFKITPQGIVTILHSFGDPSVLSDGTNNSGSPQGGLVLGADGYFYGTTPEGGATISELAAASGVLFKISSGGTYSILHAFKDGSVANDGATPRAALTVGPNGLLYGVTNIGGSSNLGAVFTLAPTFPVLTSAATASGSVSIPFSYQVVASNNPTSYSATNLPAGLSIDQTSGLISGTPTTVQTNAVNLTIQNTSGSSTVVLNLTIGAAPVPAITSILTAYGSVGAAFTYTTAATNSPASFSADSASMTNLTNAGLSLDPSTGIISGTPTSAGSISVTLTASNANGPSSSVVLSIQILATAPTLADEYNIDHSFASGNPAIDGRYPYFIIQGFDGNYYGVTTGGTNSSGTIFRMTDQGIVTILYSFPTVASSDISGPESLLQAADGNFYGTNSDDIFKITPTGQFTLLYHFPYNAGLNPLIQGYDGNFYGTTNYAGSADDGTVFKMTPQAVVTILHSFGDGSVPNDGKSPQAGLVQGTDGNFYGTTASGGAGNGGGGFGTAFEITPQGTVTILHLFGGTAVNLQGGAAKDGTIPLAALIQGSDGNFYGTTYEGGPNEDGNVFKMTPQGAVTVLYNFGSVTKDGTNPNAAVIQGYDGNFYGTTADGGLDSDGTVFQLTPQGTETILHSFGSITNDGTNPGSASLIQDTNGNFYGVTTEGGSTEDASFGSGTIYSIDAMQTATHAPIYIGSAYQEASILAPFSFTPKAAFGVSGSGAETADVVQTPTKQSGFVAALVSVLPSWLLPQAIRPAFSTTNWTLTGTLPNYLTFDSTSGTISGTPIQGGAYTVTMTPNNAIGSGTPQTVTIYIDVPPGISSALSLSTPVNTPFSYQIEALPPADTYGASALPGWLSVDPVGGIISGTPPAAGTYVFDAIASNLSGQAIQPVALMVTGGPTSIPTITSATTASAAVGTAFAYQITTNPAATSYTALSLPTGLIFDETTGTIFGTPSETGTFSLPVTAANANGSYASVLSLTIAHAAAPVIASSLLATAVEGSPFAYEIPAMGVVSNYSETGSLPAGLTFNGSTGVISGTATATGMFPINITVANGTGSDTGTLILNVAAPATFSQWETAHNNFTGAPTDTSFGDGVPNLLKYLYDINPTVPISATDRTALPTVGIDTTTNPGTKYFTLTYRQYASESGITVNVQTSPDLQTWTTVSPDLSQQIGTDPNTGDPIMEVGVISAGAKQFLRLDVTQP